MASNKGRFMQAARLGAELNEEIQQTSEPVNQEAGLLVNQQTSKLENQQTGEPANLVLVDNKAPQSQYSEDDLKLVNVGGFKVPYVVREHWKTGLSKKHLKLVPMIRKTLIELCGLPEGFTEEDL